MTFRTDINFLRGIAVISVLLFHFFPNYAPGGFLGVDVFFVISGFLIGSMYSENNFSYVTFLHKRIKRLYPLIIFITPFFLIFSYSFFRESVFEKTLLSSFSAIFFVSNIFFWKTSNYFEPLANEEIFLHTWSLSIEVQFYIAFCSLIFIAKTMKIDFKRFIIFISIISFLLCIWGYFFRPTAAFYLFPTRLWEFLLGATIFFLNKRDINKNIIFCTYILLFSCFFIFDKSDFIPVIPNLIVVLLSSIIILGKYENKLFSNKLIINLGLSSYAIYLFHFLLVSFIHNNLFLNSGYEILFFFLSIIFGYLLYKFIDSSNSIFRKKQLLSIGATYIFTFSIFVLIESFDLSKSVKQPVYNSYSREVRRDFLDMDIKSLKSYNNIGIIGDSLGEDLLYSVRTNGINFSYFNYDGMCFMSWYEYSHLPVNCEQWLALDSFIEKHEHIIITTNLHAEKSLNSIIKYISKFNKDKFIFVNSIAFGSIENLSYKYKFNNKQLDDQFNYFIFKELNESINLVNKDIKNSGYKFIDKYSFFCDDAESRCNIYQDGALDFFDDVHLTKEGAQKFGINVLRYIGDELNESY